MVDFVGQRRTERGFVVLSLKLVRLVLSRQVSSMIASVH